MTSREAAAAREALEAVIWYYLPARCPDRLPRAVAVLGAADAFAVRGSVRSREALAVTWRRLCPGAPSRALLAAADLYAACSVAASLSALESRDAQGARRLALARAASGLEPDACGTRNAAEWHRRHGEEVDDACRDAETRYHLDGIMRRRAEAARGRLRTAA